MTTPPDTLLTTTLALPSGATNWSAYATRFTELTASTLTPGDVPGFLRDWSRLNDALTDTYATLSLRADLNTADEQARQDLNAFLQDVMPQWQRHGQALTEKLLAVQDYQPSEDEAQLMRRFRAQAERYREANVTLGTQHDQLMNRYGTVTGAMTVEIGGETLTVPQAEQRLSSPDRGVREEAWRALHASKMRVAPQLDDLMRSLLPVRRQFARNTDLPDYRAYMWRVYDRVDYTPDDCRTFHHAVEAEVVPLAAELARARQEALGVSTLKPWDFTWRVPLDPHGREPLAPFRTVRELEDITEHVFTQLDPELGQQFRNMRGGYLDLGSRPNKMSHAYCTSFPGRRMPFVLMNVVGTSGDVRVLLHEMGHAFHGLASMRAQPITWNTWSPIEFVEVPSQAMELLALPYLARDRGGFYTPEELQRVKTEQLEGVILLLPWIAQMDAFQHWLYAEAGEHVTTGELDAKWLELHRRFQPHVDITGFEAEFEKGWHYYHIFRAPFYYIEYGFCWLGALGVWQNALRDQATAMRQYKQALALGSTRSVPELYRAAGTEFRFDREHVGNLMRFVRTHLGI